MTRISELITTKIKENDDEKSNFGISCYCSSPVCIKTDNRGKLAAKIYALLIAKGGYIAYLDAKDFATFNYYEPMLQEAVASDCDIVMNDWVIKRGEDVYASKNERLLKENTCLEDANVFNECIACQNKEWSFSILPNKIFSKELLLSAKSEIEKTSVIMEKQNKYEDIIITFFAMKNAKKLKNIHTGYAFLDVEGIDDTYKDCTAWENVFDAIIECVNDDVLCRTLKELKLSVSDAPKNYVDAIPLPSLEGVDKIFRWIYKKGKDVAVNYDKSDEYIAKTLGYLAQKEGIRVTCSCNAELLIPKKKLSLKERLFGVKLISVPGVGLIPKSKA